MRHYLSLEVNFKHCVMMAMGLAAFGGLFLTSTRAQRTTWTVTITVSGGTEKPVYGFLSNPPGASHCLGTNPKPTPSPENLYICAGDEVLWTPKSDGTKSEMAVYHKDLLLNKNGKKERWFHATEPNSNGGTPDLNEPKGVEHEYCVAVFDPSNGHLYIHDPKIIIGTGTRPPPKHPKEGATPK